MASVKRLWRLCARVAARAKTIDGRCKHFDLDASIRYQQQQQQQLGSKNYLGVKSSLLHHSATPYENGGKVPLWKFEI